MKASVRYNLPEFPKSFSSHNIKIRKSKHFPIIVLELDPPIQTLDRFSSIDIFRWDPNLFIFQFPEEQNEFYKLIDIFEII